jgi:hypothetical protein
MLISHPSSKPFIEATYRAVDALGPLARAASWFGGDVAENRLVVVETHPTVGLCLLLPQQDRSTLPSRKRARLLPDGSAVRAKSDWYWAIGANDHVARALGAPSVAAEDDHELVAALYCLAVAHQLAGCAGDGTRSAAIGDGHGVYAIPASIDESWVPAIERVGIAGGRLVPAKGSYDSRLIEGAKLVEVVSANAPEEPQATLVDTSVDIGDELDLYLNDNGGVWTKHNWWLRGQNDPLDLESVGMGMGIRLEPAATNSESGQWKATPTTLQIARAHGFSAPHLNGGQPLVIQVRLR